jgi:hypothetical protein
MVIGVLDDRRNSGGHVCIGAWLLHKPGKTLNDNKGVAVLSCIQSHWANGVDIQHSIGVYEAVM